MVKKKLPPLDQILKALGDPLRLSVIHQILQEGEKPCGTFEHDVTKATFSHHINILVDAGVITRREEGTRKYLSLDPGFKTHYPDLYKLLTQKL